MTRFALACALSVGAGCSSRAPAPPASSAPPAPNAPAAPPRAAVPRVGELHGRIAELAGADLPPAIESTIVVGELDASGARWNAMAQGWGRRPGISGVAFRVAGPPTAGHDYPLEAASPKGPGAPVPALAPGQASIVFTEGAEHAPVYWIAGGGRLEVTALDGDLVTFRVRDTKVARQDGAASFRAQLDGKARLKSRP